MAKREISSRLQQMKFMQRGKPKEESPKPSAGGRQHPQPPALASGQRRDQATARANEEHWYLSPEQVAAATQQSRQGLGSATCSVVVVEEADPRPGGASYCGRMAFGSFIPPPEMKETEDSRAGSGASPGPSHPPPEPHSSTSGRKSPLSQTLRGRGTPQGGKQASRSPKTPTANGIPGPVGQGKRPREGETNGEETAQGFHRPKEANEQGGEGKQQGTANNSNQHWRQQRPKR